MFRLGPCWVMGTIGAPCPVCICAEPVPIGWWRHRRPGHNCGTGNPGRLQTGAAQHSCLIEAPQEKKLQSLASSAKLPDARRRALVEATIECLKRFGHEGLSIRRISAQAKVSIGLINHHFPTKDALIAEATGTSTASWLEA